MVHLGDTTFKAAEREELLGFPDLVDLKHILNLFLFNTSLVELSTNLWKLDDVDQHSVVTNSDQEGPEETCFQNPPHIVKLFGAWEDCECGSLGRELAVGWPWQVEDQGKVAQLWNPEHPAVPINTGMNLVKTVFQPLPGANDYEKNEEAARND